MKLRPGITISIQDMDVFWNQEIILDQGRFPVEITLEDLYQVFKARLKEEGGIDAEETEDGSTES